MGTYLVVVNEGYMTIGGLGRARVQRTEKVEAASERLAWTEARRRWPGRGEIASLKLVRTWHITVRSRHDKRRRETFIIHATTEHDAVQHLKHLPAATRFADIYSRRGQEANIVRIEDRTPTQEA